MLSDSVTACGSDRFLATARAFRPALLLAALLAALAPMPAAEAQTPPDFGKAFTPGTIGPGAVSTLRFDIVNPGGTPVRSLAFVDNLPAGVTISAVPNASTTCAGAVLTAPAGGGTITFSDGGVGAGSSCFVLVDVTSATPGTHTNVSGDLTSDAGNSGPATADLIVATDRPGFTKSFTPASVGFGGRSTLTFTIDNSANANGAINLNFTDNLPSGMVVASPSNASSTCNGGTITAPSGGSSISYAPTIPGEATVAAGASCTVSVDILGDAVGTLGNTSGELFSLPALGGPSRSSGKASAVLTVTAEQLTLTKSFSDDPVPPGGTVTLQFTVSNLNRDFAASDIAFSDDLGAVLTGLEAVGLPANDVCGSGSQLTGTGVITLTGGNLPAEGSCTFSVTLQVPASAPSGAFVNTTSPITADVDGRPVEGSAASDTLFVDAVPVLTKEYVDDPVGAGGSVTLEFTIVNTSTTDSATDLAFTDELDVILPSATVPANGFCGAGSTATFLPQSGGLGPRLIVSGGSLAPAASCTFSITLNVEVAAPGGLYPNTTSPITATVGGRSVTGGPASDDLTVVGAPILTKEFVDDPVAPGDTVTLRFTLVYSEAEPGTATGITFTDDLDAALSGLEAVGLPAADVCGIGSEIDGVMTLTLTGGTLAPGESCSFDVTLSVPEDAPIGTHTNVTSAVVASALGATATGASASDDLRIAGLELTKEFIDDPVIAGGTATLRFTVVNQSAVSAASDITFLDNLDDAVSGMAASGLPLVDPCGSGSSLVGLSGDSLLQLLDGSLAPGASCTFDVTLTVPAGTPDDSYTNVTTGISATVEGQTVFFENAFDVLEVDSDFLFIEKEFLDDPATPGETVTLRFTVSNLSPTETVSDISFSDDLEATLSGLAATGLPAADVCGAGSSIDGTDLVTLSDGSLGPSSQCVIDVTLSVPPDAPFGAVFTNVTSEVTGTVGGFTVSGDPATDDLAIDSIVFTKEFSGTVQAGDVVTLTFTIQNLSATDTVTGLAFTDDLDAVLPGLEAVGLPALDVCGEGSSLDGVSFLTFTGGSLLPGGSCSFSVDLTVPEDTPGGIYLNETGELLASGLAVAAPATAELEVLAADQDEDDDGVPDGEDVCPGTVIPEDVPTVRLLVLHYALVDGDGVFDTRRWPFGPIVPSHLTIEHTGGCSCEQIIDVLGLGHGHRKFGCSVGVMLFWVHNLP